MHICSCNQLCSSRLQRHFCVIFQKPNFAVPTKTTVRISTSSAAGYLPDTVQTNSKYTRNFRNHPRRPRMRNETETTASHFSTTNFLNYVHFITIVIPTTTVVTSLSRAELFVRPELRIYAIQNAKLRNFLAVPPFALSDLSSIRNTAERKITLGEISPSR